MRRTRATIRCDESAPSESTGWAVAKGMGQMVKVLVIGYVPNAVDFTDPVLPPGMDEGAVAAGLKRDAEKMKARGWEAEHLMIRPKENIRERILDHLGAKQYDCIVIGAGVRLTTRPAI
jgi:hypothetical protein